MPKITVSIPDGNDCDGCPFLSERFCKRFKRNLRAGHSHSWTESWDWEYYGDSGTTTKEYSRWIPHKDDRCKKD